MPEKTTRRRKPSKPDPAKLYEDSKSVLEHFLEFMGMQGQRAESSSDIKAPEAYTTNLKAIADAGVSMHQLPAFLAYSWAGRDRGHYDADVINRQKHDKNLDALTVSKIAASNTALSIAEFGLVGMFLDWFNKLVNIDEQPAWLAKILRTENYGDSILALVVMFMAKASGVALDEAAFTEAYRAMAKAKK